ncbi:MAG: zinc ABC transporter substrate-binding protein [Sulfurimonas sp.]|nr:zinc ABC transporter substrate-binding protein [Sulfurimonas sp.]
MKDYRNIIFVLIIALFLLQMLVNKEDAKSEKVIQKPIIALSTFSLYDIAKHISEDSLEIIMILPIGVDAHSYEPTPKMMAKLEKSALVVYSGAGLEPWIDGYNFKNKTINMSKFVNLRELESQEHNAHAHTHHHHAKENSTDPHYWLDIENMIKATNLIADELIKIDLKNKDKYIKNRDNYIKILKNLDSLYKEKLKSCSLDTIIVNHNAFSYLSSNYDFHVKALSGFSPDTQVSPKDMIRIIDDIKEHKVSTIFFENFVSDKAIKSLAQEANVSVETLQPLGNITKDESEQNFTYEDIMKINLTKISKALKCQ